MRKTARTLGRRLFPAWAAERAIRYERMIRCSRGIPEVARRVSERLGSTVLGGPFEGMRLLPGFEERIASPVLKLVGSYEQQLHRPLEVAIEMRPKRIANVGSAEGYYATGLALRLPGAVVHAYDLASTAREMARETARINGVSERMLVHGRCRRFPAGLDLLVCDIEGAEDELLDPEALSSTMVIVETHDHAVPGITEALINRFAPTHDVDVLESIDVEQTAPLDWLSRREIEIAFDEMRADAEQCWLLMRPRALKGTSRPAGTLLADEQVVPDSADPRPD
jgi:hypothetical protein